MTSPATGAADARMRIGVYVDGFNLYYGAGGTPGWRWLDIRALAQRIVSRLSYWQGALIARIVYCTAVMDAGGRP